MSGYLIQQKDAINAIRRMPSSAYSADELILDDATIDKIKLVHISAIKNILPINVVDVRDIPSGEWLAVVNKSGMIINYKCSKCIEGNTRGLKFMKYCPECGSRNYYKGVWEG